MEILLFLAFLSPFLLGLILVILVASGIFIADLFVNNDEEEDDANL